MEISPSSSPLSDVPSVIHTPPEFKNIAASRGRVEEHTTGDVCSSFSRSVITNAAGEHGKANDSSGHLHDGRGIAHVNFHENVIVPSARIQDEVDQREDSPLVHEGTKRDLPQNASERPSRRRIAPTRLSDDIGPPTKAKPKVKSSQGRGRRPTWDPEYLLQNPKSKIAKINLLALLTHDGAWTGLTPYQQSKLLKLLPGAPEVDERTDEPLPNIAKEILKTNTAFQADVRLFQEDLEEGRLDPQWQKQAQEAMEMRARGDFDDWKEQNLEKFWGQKQKLQGAVVAGDSRKIKLEALVRAGSFRTGDIWVFSRGFKTDKGLVQVEKEATIAAISDDNRLSFSFPPGKLKFPSSEAGLAKETGFIIGPQALTTAILNEDGSIENPPHGNAWKEFRCFRNHQDMGSLWEIREVYHARFTN